MRLLKFLGVLLLAGGAFGGGYLMRGAGPDESARPPERKILYYVDPMHPAYTSDKPGVAPDCGMNLEPVYADPGGSHASPSSDGALDAGLPPGTVRVPPERQQLIGLRFATATPDDGRKSVRTVGTIAYDETRIAHVHTRFDGWVERVFVDFTGELVRKGQPMLTVYSPEMLASQQELLLAARARTTLANNPLPSASQYGDSLFDAAKRRLQLWQLSDDQMERVLETGQPIRSITVHAPVTGYVTARKAFPNVKVTPELDLYTIVDLSRVWILADVFEADIPSVRVGDTAHVTLPYAADAAPLTARVTYIQPELDPMTRTLKVRLEAANPGMRLKPDMFVNVDFAFEQERRLTIPVDAVLDTGDRQTVFVDRGNGYLEPRQVRVGERRGDRVAILSGLSEGERVVASGTFLIDSESQLKAAAAGMGAPAGHSHPTAPAAPAPASPPTEHKHD